MKDKTYLDIGHGDPNSILWIYHGGRIESTRTGSKTHEKVWGFDAMFFWRGRFDPATNELSVAQPVNSKTKSIPQYLEDALEEKFGTGLQVWHFNPTKKGRRVT